jgi:alkylation response protein AidB-like acyl-CoA dehydrogenase
VREPGWVRSPAVHFALTDDQEALRDGVRALCTGRFPMGDVRAMASHPGAVDPGRWKELADAGVFALRTPDVGLGAADAVLVFEELGRALVPGPLVATHLAAGVVDGDVVGAIERPPAGAPAVIEHFDALDALAVVDDDGVWVIDPATLDAAAVDPSLDPLTPVHRVDVLLRGEHVAGADAAMWRRDGALLTAALQVGVAEALGDLAVAYAKERRQFGKAIGAFQAVKHLCADMLVRSEVARAAVYAAGVTIDDPEIGDAWRAVHAAVCTAGDAAERNGKACVQVHGGMGFTWEVDAHLYLKRAWVLSTAWGGPDEHADALAAYL